MLLNRLYIKLMLVMTALLFIVHDSDAQIISPASDFMKLLNYPDSEGQDPLYVFFQSRGIVKKGALEAQAPAPGNYNFDWSRYNPGSGGFDAPFHSVTNVPSSGVSDLEEGGYRVRIWDGTGTDTLFFAWVMMDNLYVATEKTADNKVKPVNYTCDFLVMTGFVEPDTFTYYDLVTHLPVHLELDFRFKWTSDNPDLRIPNDTTILDPNITYLPPVKDTWYILTATDEFGMTGVDSVLYESIQTKASFTVDYYDKIENEFNPDLTGDWSVDMGSLDALLTVRFTNESENGARFDWVYVDTLGGIKQTETTYDTVVQPEYTYELADEYYYPYMVSTSDAGCVDTFRLEEPIFVVPSQLHIPNVFTPNGDTHNDYFKFKHQSIKTCRITIVDRNGKVVYKREIDDIYSWEGWDGNLHDSSRPAPEGQYYYVIQATGYDGKEYKDPNIFERRKQNKDNTSTTGGSSSTGQEPDTSAGTQYTGWLYLYRNL